MTSPSLSSPAPTAAPGPLFLDPFGGDYRPISGSRGALLKKLRDVRMIHQRQGLPFRFEASDDALGVHAQFDDLERDAAADRLFLFRHIDHAAPALADLLKQLVTANDRARLFQHRRRCKLSGFRRWRFQEAVRGMVAQEVFQACARRLVPATGTV